MTTKQAEKLFTPLPTKHKKKKCKDCHKVRVLTAGICTPCSILNEFIDDAMTPNGVR